MLNSLCFAGAQEKEKAIKRKEQEINSEEPIVVNSIDPWHNYKKEAILG